MTQSHTRTVPHRARAPRNNQRGLVASDHEGVADSFVASSPRPPVPRWARLQRDVQSVLRRGAWYPVLSIGPDHAVLDVDNAPVRVSRDYLEFREVRPSLWTIVPRPRDADHLPEAWGELYAVCPHCAARAPVGPRSGAAPKRCTRCEQSFDVAWDEGYLRA